MTKIQYEGSTFNEEQYEVGTEAFKGVLSTPAPSKSLDGSCSLEINLWSILAGISQVEKLLAKEFKFLREDAPEDIRRAMQKLEAIALDFEENKL